MRGRGESKEGRQGACQVARGHFPLPKALPSSPLLPMHNQASTYFLLLTPSKGNPSLCPTHFYSSCCMDRQVFFPVLKNERIGSTHPHQRPLSSVSFSGHIYKMGTTDTDSMPKGWSDNSSRQGSLLGSRRATEGHRPALRSLV